MALKKCPDCGKMVSSRVDACPECGCPAEYFEEVVQENVAETASNGASGGQKEGFKKHALSIEKVDDIYVLFMVDDDGKEIRISENKNGLSAIGYLETEQYVFYIMDKVEYGYSPKSHACITSSFERKLFRYDKSTKNRKCIREKFNCSANRGGFDLEKSCNNDEQRYLFATNNLLLYQDYTGLHRMDYDGGNDRIIIEKIIGICWIHNGIIWYHVDVDHSGIGLYSLIDKSQQIVDYSVKGLCTDGNIVYLCNSGKISRMNIDGTGKEEIATCSFESIIVGVYDMKIENGNLIITAGKGIDNKHYEVHKGDRFMFS